MRHLFTQNWTKLGNLGLKCWVKWKGGGVEMDEMQIFTGDFLFMINVLKPVLLKPVLEYIWSVLHYKVFRRIFIVQIHNLDFQSVGSL
jgi:hypothetical protein